jgi:hypothetical protein
MCQVIVQNFFPALKATAVDATVNRRFTQWRAVTYPDQRLFCRLVSLSFVALSLDLLKQHCGESIKQSPTWKLRQICQAAVAKVLETT